MTARRKLPKQKAGQPIQARTLNLPSKEIERQGNVRGTTGIVVTDTPGGVTYRATSQNRIYAKLTSGDGQGNYTWTEQIRSGPSWADGSFSGTFAQYPARELNNNPDVETPYYVWLIQSQETEEWFFQVDSCRPQPPEASPAVAVAQSSALPSAGSMPDFGFVDSSSGNMGGPDGTGWSVTVSPFNT